MKWLLVWSLASFVSLLGYFFGVLFGVLLSRVGTARSDTDVDEAASTLPPSTPPRDEGIAGRRPLVGTAATR